MIYNKYFTLFYFLLISFSFGADRHEAYIREYDALITRVIADIKRDLKDKLQQFNYLSTIDTVEANKIILAEDGNLDNNASPERMTQAKQMIFRHFVDLSLNDSEWNYSYKYPKFSEQAKDAFKKAKDLVLKEHLSYLAVTYEIIDSFLREWLQGRILTLDQISQKIDWAQPIFALMAKSKQTILQDPTLKTVIEETIHRSLFNVSSKDIRFLHNIDINDGTFRVSIINSTRKLESTFQFKSESYYNPPGDGSCFYWSLWGAATGEKLNYTNCSNVRQKIIDVIKNNLSNPWIRFHMSKFVWRRIDTLQSHRKFNDENGRDYKCTNYSQKTIDGLLKTKLVSYYDNPQTIISFLDQYFKNDSDWASHSYELEIVLAYFLKAMIYREKFVTLSVSSPLDYNKQSLVKLSGNHFVAYIGVSFDNIRWRLSE